MEGQRSMKRECHTSLTAQAQAQHRYRYRDSTDADTDTDIDTDTDTTTDTTTEIQSETRADAAVSADTCVASSTSAKTNVSILKPRHPNLHPLLGVFETPLAYYFIYNSSNTFARLHSVARFNNIAVPDIHIRFYCYQLLQLLHALHQQNLYIGDLQPESLCLSTSRLWLYLCQLNGPLTVSPALTMNLQDMSSSATMQWCTGKLSNFDYLMALNVLAGRVKGNPSFHPVFPWVIDFTASDGLLRDLTKSKFRLSKGDEQLDFTFQSSSPHHITDPLSEISYHIYMARRMPKEVLQRVVRTRFEPNEYPVSMTRIYQWACDEAIPEFYSDPTVFKSIHPDLPDLALPDWALDASDFIQKHRMALESDKVSSMLHHWIDLVFGYKLSGTAAVEAKNVTLSTEGAHGLVQLFKDPHPAKMRLTAYGSNLESASNSPSSGDKQAGSKLKGPRRPASHRYFASPPLLPGSIRSKSEPSALTVATNKTVPFADVMTRAISAISTPTNESFPSTPVANTIEPFPFSIDLQDVGAVESSLKNLASMESLNRFCLTSGFVTPMYRLPIAPDDDENNWQAHKALDLFALGCIIGEMYSRKPLFNEYNMKLFIQGRYSPVFEDFPLGVASFLSELLQNDWRLIPSAHALCFHSLFPPFFLQTHKLLLQIYAESDWSIRLHIFMSEILSHPRDSVKLLLPLYIEFLQHHQTRSLAADLLERMIELIGPLDFRRYIFSTLATLYSIQEDVQLQLRILRVSFLQSLLRWFGYHVFIEQILGHVVGALKTTNQLTGDAAAEAVVDLSNTFGLTVTLSHILPILLRHLTRLYADVTTVAIVGICQAQGESFALTHVVYPLLDILRTNVGIDVRKIKLSMNALSLLGKISSILAPATCLKVLLMDNSDLFKILNKPPGSIPFVKHLATVLGKICQRIGVESTIKFALPYYQQFFAHYLWVPAHTSGGRSTVSVPSSPMRSVSPTPPESPGSSSIHETDHDFLYCPEIAEALYSPLSDLLGPERVRQYVNNSTLVEKFVNRFRADPNEVEPRVESPDAVFAEDLYNEDLFADAKELFPGTDNVPWSMKVSVQQSVKAHTGSVRKVSSLFDERIFASAGKDCLVKCWSLQPLQCIVTYTGHKDSVKDVQFIPGCRRMASLSRDHSVHIWDVENGKRQFKFAYDAAQPCIRPLEHESSILIGTGISTLRCHDLNTGQLKAEWRLASSSNVSVCGLAVDPMYGWIAAASTQGWIYMLDPRTGVLIDSWKAHEGEIVHMCTYNDQLISAGADKLINVWNIRTDFTTPVRVSRNLTEVLSSMTVFDDTLICSAGSKVAVGSLSDTNSPLLALTSKMLVDLSPRDKKDKVSIKTMAVLPYNRLLLTGSEDGQIRICE
eukprot:GILK01012798.1.p1 GENE.GILK01012798.1~~GILK01012798.1.p1  ORF type:complete len:1374 (-),score=245.12 GILK01012798.1:23-4144(-)